MPEQQESETSLSGAPDRELISMVRAGDSRAYGVLWARHAGSAYAVARSFPTLDADDLVSEAFVKVLATLRNGRGPEGPFRPYISMAVRNLGRSLYVREPSMLDIEVELEGMPTPSGEDLVVEGYERSVMLAAFQSLPPRWQEVLWHSEVDGLKPSAIAPLLGVQPNAASALLIRAKKGLKDAWVAQHLAEAESSECRVVIRELGAYARGALSRRTTHLVDNHLTTCASCNRALEEARNVSNLPFALLPAVAGVGGAGVLATQLTTPELPQALIALGVEPSLGDNANVEAVSDDVRRRSGLRRSVVIAGLALLLLVAVSATTIVILNPVVTDVTAQDASVEASATSEPSSPNPTTGPTTAVMTPSPDPSADEDTVSPPSTDGTEPERQSEDQPSPPQESAPPEQQPPVDTPPDEDLLQALTGVLSQSDPRMYPVVSGGGAAPGATIQLVDETGATVGRSSARADGTWRARVTDGASGAHSVQAQQSLGEFSSPGGPALMYITDPPPVLLSPLADEVVSAASFSFSFVVPPGTVVQREVVGVSRLYTLRMASFGSWNERMTVPVGEHTMRVRFYDPVTGDFGPFSEVKFRAE